MGESDVLRIWLSRFIGIGFAASISRVYEQLPYSATPVIRKQKVYKVLNIAICVPFFDVYIYCRKSKNNHWLRRGLK